VASNDHGHSRKNWIEKEIKTIRANLYKLASTRYEDLANELGFEESVLRDGVAKYFELEEENQSKDLREMAVERILAYMDWTKEDSFSEIESIHGISIDDKENNVIFFLEFKKYLGVGEEIEDGKSDDKVEGQTHEVAKVMVGGKSWASSNYKSNLEWVGPDLEWVECRVIVGSGLGWIWAEPGRSGASRRMITKI
nr:hypothetical protein [Tanacetum cinerariifolium]